MTTIAHIPDHLLRRDERLAADVRRAGRLTAWVRENIASSVSLWDLHLERVRRGFESPFDPSFRPERKSGGRRQGSVGK